MLFFLLLATASVAIAADPEAEPLKVETQKVEIKEEPKPAESVRSQGHDDGYSFADGLELMRHREQRFNAERYRILGRHDIDEHDDDQYTRARDVEHTGPVILRTPGPLPNDGHPDIEAQNKIIADVFSPDYYQPTWVLDYRYLKTGGRDYTRGPGGQILILPKGVRSNEKKEFPDYDAYLEHLRLSRLSEQQHQRRGHDDHDRDRDHWQYGQGRQRVNHGHDRGHGQTMWHRYA